MSKGHNFTKEVCLETVNGINGNTHQPGLGQISGLMRIKKTQIMTLTRFRKSNVSLKSDNFTKDYVDMVNIMTHQTGL